MRIIDLVLKDLLQIFRDKRSVFFLVAMPVAFTLFMGFAYNSGKSTSSAPKDQRIPLGWVNNDAGGALSQQLFDVISKSDSIKVVKMAATAVDEAVRKGDVAGALIIPAGYSQQITSTAIPIQLTLIANLNSAQGQSLFQLLRTPVTQLLSSVEIGQLSAKSVGKADNLSELNAGFAAASKAWSKTDSTALIKVQMALAKPDEMWYGDNPYNQASPGILVQFAIFGLVTSGQILVQERKTRTLQRMISTSMQAWEIVAGHMLAMFTVVFLQEALLVIFGQLALGVNYMHEPLGTLLISVALGLWIAAMGLLIGVLVKEDGQVVLLSMMAMFIFSAMGGTWFPLEVSSGAFAIIGKLMPSAWAMTGYQNILIRGLGMEAVWQPALILLAYAFGFFGLAVWRFQKMDA